MTDNVRYHEDLKRIMDEYVHCVYACTRRFPKEELYGSTSQLRRAALSVVLNSIEGYARQRNAVLRNFLEIAYGSLKESVYLLDFSLKEGYLSRADYERATSLANRIGAMLWGTLKNLRSP